MGFNNDRRGFGCASSAKTYTVEDYPLTLPDIKKLKTLSILGNSTQDGTPSPDNPVDVVGTGERTGNLFDISQVGDTNTLYNDGEKLKVTAYSNSTNLSVEKFLAMTGLRPGDVFTVARQYEVINGTANSATGSIRFNKKDGSGQFLIIPGNKDVAINVVPDDFNSDIYSAINFYGVNSGNLKEVVFSEIQILKGSYTADTLPPYEPYGYKVAVTASGRNLFDKSKAWAEYESIALEGNYTTKILKLKPNTIYYCKSFSPVESNDVVFLSSNKVVSLSISTAIALTTNNISRKFENQITTKEDGYMYIGANNTVNIDDIFQNTKLYIIEGSYTTETLPPYEPYKSPQSFNVYTPDVLHGVGDAHDTVILDFDKHKAELVQEVNKIVMTGNESMQVYEYPPNPRYNGFSSFTLLNGKKYSREEYFSNYFGSSGSNDLWIGIENYVLYFVNSQFYNAELEDKGLSNFVTFLKQQYDSGNPATIYYDNSRYEPTTTDITSLQDWDALPRLKGTWILSATGGTEPTLKAAYTSNTNPYPDYSNIVSVLPIYPDLDITGDDPTSERGDMEETEDQQETTSTDEPTSETNNSIDILDLYE